MKTKSKTSPAAAFSALDLLIVIATIAVVVAILLPAVNRPPRASRISCISNLKSLGLGFRLWANDNEDSKYPVYQETNEVWQYFQTIGSEIGSPKVLLCPDDKPRAKRKTFPLDFESGPNSFSASNFQNSALSYFYGVDSSEDQPNMILAGDRNISTNASMLPGMLEVGTDKKVQWTEDIHKNVGNILLADGSAHQVSDARLRDQIKVHTNGNQRLLIP